MPIFGFLGHMILHIIMFLGSMVLPNYAFALGKTGSDKENTRQSMLIHI